jgi:hypothetical protein
VPGRPEDRRDDRGAAQLNAALVVLAAVVLAALICLALVAWFGRLA